MCSDFQQGCIETSLAVPHIHILKEVSITLPFSKGAQIET
jgi:hypothetical protein